jgi:ABC-type transporter Mla maintaining outer membrane lipid asymmetry ATPase subunit MlaF
MPAEIALSQLAALRMEGVTIPSMRDQQLAVANDVNWTVMPGDFWAVAGLQGSGKSDFLLLAGGLMPPITGQYRLFGERMPIFEEARLPQRLRLGLVFEGGQLFNHLTVKENVALPGRYHHNQRMDEGDAAIADWLEAFELGPWADSTPGAIGRNWHKRVGLARALTMRPEVLLVDNPLGGLDLRHTLWWLNFLSELNRGHPLMKNQPVTVIATTADLRPWETRAHQFAILRDKHFSVLGSWEQLETANKELLDELLITPGGSLS